MPMNLSILGRRFTGYITKYKKYREGRNERIRKKRERETTSVLVCAHLLCACVCDDNYVK